MFLLLLVTLLLLLLLLEKIGGPLRLEIQGSRIQSRGV